jgi:hypothetical protein
MTSSNRFRMTSGNRSRMNRALVFAGVISLLATASAGCSLGQGEGEVHSDALFARDCVTPSPESCNGADGLDVGCDAYDLLPDFFAAIPYRETIQMRIQRGTDIVEFSDGLAVLVNDIDKIRTALQDKRDAAILDGATEDEALELYVEVPVAIPAGVTPAGSTVAPLPPCDAATQLCEVQPAAVSLYLQKSCHNQNTILYAVSGWVRFRSLFSGNPNEKSAAEKFTDAELDVVVGDPREAPLGEPIGPDSIPPEVTSHLTGYFRFYFERGRPGQPFPG